MNNIGWCKAVEDMMGIEIPDRAKALRMVFSRTFSSHRSPCLYWYKCG